MVPWCSWAAIARRERARLLSNLPHLLRELGVPTSEHHQPQPEEMTNATQASRAVRTLEAPSKPRPPVTSSPLAPGSRRAAEGKQKRAFGFSANALIFCFSRSKHSAPVPGETGRTEVKVISEPAASPKGRVGTVQRVQPLLPGIKHVGSFLQFATILQSHYLIFGSHNNPGRSE